jgi:hypothetical protein
MVILSSAIGKLLLLKRGLENVFLQAPDLYSLTNQSGGNLT